MDRIKIRGHQRAGNHYLAALIELNLYAERKDPEQLHDQRGHLLPNQCLNELENPKLLNIFVYRKFPDTLDSIYRMRDRFRLRGTKADFETKKLGCLFTTDISVCDIEVNWHYRRESKQGVSNYFGSFLDFTLSEWWSYFVSEWLKQSWRKNVYMCRYENLITNRGRNGILRDIARAIGRPIKFPTKNITARVGYFDKGDDSWRTK